MSRILLEKSMVDAKHALKAGIAIGLTGKTRFVHLVCYKIDPGFRKLEANVRLQAKEDILSAVDTYKRQMGVYVYSLTATRGDSDFLIWQAAPTLEALETFAGRLAGSNMGPYLRAAHSFAMAVPEGAYTSILFSGEPVVQDTELKPGEQRPLFLFVCPLRRTAAWLQLPALDRERALREPNAIAARFRSLKLALAQSCGLDDNDLALTVEAGSAEDIAGFVRELRESPIGQHLACGVPAITAIARELGFILDSLG